MKVDVEPFDLDIALHAQAYERIDDLENNPGSDGAVHEGTGHIIELDQHLLAVAVDQPAFARGVDRVGGKSARQHGARRATDAVHAPCIKCVVIAEDLLHMDRGEVANDPGDDAYD